MNSTTGTPKRAANKLLIAVAVVVGAIRIIDFIFNGHQIRDLLAGIGFALIAYGAYQDGFSKATASNARGRHAGIAGIALVLVALVLRFVN